MSYGPSYGIDDGRYYRINKASGDEMYQDYDGVLGYKLDGSTVVKEADIQQLVSRVKDYMGISNMKDKYVQGLLTYNARKHNNEGMFADSPSNFTKCIEKKSQGMLYPRVRPRYSACLRKGTRKAPRRLSCAPCVGERPRHRRRRRSRRRSRRSRGY